VKILFINPFGIGDVIFTTPLIESIKSKYPESYIGYLCNIRTAPILFSNTKIDKVFVFERDEYRKLWQNSKIECASRIWGLLQEVRREGFDIVLDFSLARDYGFFSMLGGIGKRIGYNYKNRGLFLTDKISLIGGYSGKHVIDHHKEFLPLLEPGLPMDNYPKIYTNKEDDEKARQILGESGISSADKYICLMPGAGQSWGENAFRKRWPIDRFAELALRISSDFGIKTVILGSPDEKDICDYISKKAPDSVNLCGRLGLMADLAIMKHAQCAIANEGGPLHMAVAIGIKTVSVLGPIDEKVYGPYSIGDRHIVVRDVSLHCSPCYNSFKLPECKDLKCLDNISVDEVVKAVEQTLSS
jgi:lipopolysaccharide heptosyltransferase II